MVDTAREYTSVVLVETEHPDETAEHVVVAARDRAKRSREREPSVAGAGETARQSRRSDRDRAEGNRILDLGLLIKGDALRAAVAAAIVRAVVADEPASGAVRARRDVTDRDGILDHSTVVADKPAGGDRRGVSRANVARGDRMGDHPLVPSDKPAERGGSVLLIGTGARGAGDVAHRDRILDLAVVESDESAGRPVLAHLHVAGGVCQSDLVARPYIKGQRAFYLALVLADKPTGIDELAIHRRRAIGIGQGRGRGDVAHRIGVPDPAEGVVVA